MTDQPHRPQQAYIRAILKDEALTYAARVAAIELYYHTQWETGRLKAAGALAAHLRNDLQMGRNSAARIILALRERGYIEGDYFNPNPKKGHPKSGTPKKGTPKKGTPKKVQTHPQKGGTPPPKKGAPPPPKRGHTNYLSSFSLSREETVEPTERARSSGNQSSEAGEALASDTSRLWDEWIEQSQPPPPAQPPQELTEEERGRQLAAELTRPWGADHAEEVRRFHEKMDALEGRQRNG